MSISWQNSETEFFFTTRFLNSLVDCSESLYASPKLRGMFPLSNDSNNRDSLVP